MGAIDGHVGRASDQSVRGTIQRVVSGWNYNTVRLRAREHPISQTGGRFLVGEVPQTRPLLNGGRWNESPDFDGLTGQDHAILPTDEQVQRHDDP